jgi:glycerol-1-phosphate dehydrogenase [NAD(P)+]
MEDLSQSGERVSHGACVAVGCVTILTLYDWLLRQDLTRLDTEGILAHAPSMGRKAAQIATAFGPGDIAERALIETARKHLTPAQHRARLTNLMAHWPAIADRLKSQLVPAAAMRAMLSAAGSPSDAADIGVTPDHLRRTVANARFLRDRYTILDLLDETGLLDCAIDEALPRASAQATGF